ncbi:MAG: FAD-dependent oxidoreductase [Chloroflexi bacterium]|nr:FAD-dependent oxidoreductase [Chloroflexota bacterium]
MSRVAGKAAVVMGGGLAGLAAAHTLARSGKQVAVLERADGLGGLSRTIVHRGFRFDIGGHRWFTKKDELNLFLHDLLGGELIDIRRLSHIYFDGKYIEYPISFSSVLRGVKPWMVARAGLDYLVSRALRGRRDGTAGTPSMRDAYVEQFGRTLYETFFEQYSRKVWGHTCDELSGDWVAQRSRGLTLSSIAKSTITGRNGRRETLADRFKYPRLGIGQIGEVMGDSIKVDGGEVLLDAGVCAVFHRQGIVESVVYEWKGGLHEVEGSHIISSIPITDLVGLLCPPAPLDVLEAATRLSYRDLITVNVMLDRESVTNDTWIYMHDPDIVFGRLHEPTNWSPHMAPSGKTSLVAECFCSVGDEIWSASDDVLCEMTVDQLSNSLGFISRRDVLGAFVVRSRQAYPTYLIGYDRALEKIKGYLTSLRNLQIVGRSGTFRYNNMDHSIETGMLAARNILGEELDIEAVNREREYLEARMVAG